MVDKKLKAKVYTAAHQIYGEENQFRKLQEECAELIAAVNRYGNLRVGPTYTNLLEEIADVEVMLEQARLILGPAIEKVIDGWKKKKIERLALRLNIK